MNSNRLDEIRLQLETELELSDAEVGRLAAELAAAERERKSIKDAVSALGKGPSPKKQTIKKTNMKKAVHALLAGKATPVMREKLDAALRDHFTRKGFRLTGFPLRLNEVLAEEGIEEDESGVYLATEVAVGG